MNSRGKSTASGTTPEGHHWSEDLARLHCLQALFPDWIDNDPFIIRQLKASIEASIRQQPGVEDSFEAFSALAQSLRDGSPNPFPDTHAFVRVDFNNRSWDPLFARQEIIAGLKGHAGTDHIFLLIIGLRRALFPGARYHTRQRQQVCQDAIDYIDQLARAWSTRSSRVHILYV
jgi:hypothetical protein